MKKLILLAGALLKRKYIVRGTVRLQGVDADGNVLWEDTKENLIVTLGRRQFCHLLVGDVTGRFITTIGFGTGTAAVTAADTGLTGAFTKAVGSATYPVDGTVVIAWSLLTSEANGMTINEMGLFTGDGTMFSRVLKGPIAKNNTFGVTGTWTLAF